MKNTIYNNGKDKWEHGEEIPGYNEWHKYLGPCPHCGSRTFDYGGSWRCVTDYCFNSASNPISNLGPAPAWWNTGIQVVKDGNAWWAHDADYVDPMESIVGWGSNPGEAVIDYFKNKSNPVAVN